MCGNPTLYQPNEWTGYDTDAMPCAASDHPGCVYADFPPEPGACWTISASLTDPFVNSGPLPPGEASLYLWLVYLAPSAMKSAELRLDGDLNVISVTGMNSSLITHAGGDPRELQIAAAGCPFGYLPVALITVSAATAIGGTTWGRVKSGYDSD
jgi:hypothetical protein